MSLLDYIKYGFLTLYKIPLFYLHVLFCLDVAVKEGWLVGLNTLFIVYVAFSILGGCYSYVMRKMESE